MNPDNPFFTPILLIIYNRPDHTRKVMEAIRRLEPRFLYITADGPNKNKPGDDEKCKLTREIALEVEWRSEVKKRFLETNLGCGKGVSSGITWFFEQVEEGIILEDDCIPEDSFFPYCAFLLNHFRNDTNIMHVGGRNNLTEERDIKESVYFSAYNHIWGWATWRRAWNLYDFNMSDLGCVTQTRRLNYYFKNKHIREYWKQELVELKNNPVDTWDYQWLYTIWKNKGLSVLPSGNLVQNIGFGEGATHTTIDFSSEMASYTDLKFPLVLPRNKRIDYRADELYFQSRIKRIPGRLSRLKIKIGKILKGLEL